MRHIKFFDENSRQWWIPDTGGANIPALNDLLRPFDISFGDFVGEGHFKLGDHSMYYASGATLKTFPNNRDDVVIGTNLNDQGASIITNGKSQNIYAKQFLPIMGLFQTNSNGRFLNKTKNRRDPPANESIKDWDVPFNHSILENRNLFSATVTGRIAVFGDSNCLDSSHMEKACFWLLTTILDFAMNSHKSMLLDNLNRISEFREMKETALPIRMPGSNLKKFSLVVRHKKKFILQCEKLDWIVATTLAISPTLELDVDRIEGNQNNNIIANLNTELAKITWNNDKYVSDQIDNNIKISVLFMITLSLTVIIVFILFLKGKIGFSSFK
ncbi:PREDICTED: membrane-bound transcription factor site-1 protease [Drosophila arizonae]|uniref:Membrane-bound transcription factor site-1 protease n=1 Tax=Drosophila arizonae TaxID=7263 RepID=A0ABM1P0T4_DROAR|nr:PREDICTED: membrane-bound transcription factor site-1 protease [Drosophila arizonae]